MPLPLIFGVPVATVATEAAVGIVGTVVATRLLGVSDKKNAYGMQWSTPQRPGNQAQSGTSTQGPKYFWQDGIDAGEAAMIAAVGLAAFGVAVFVVRKS